MFRDGFQYFLFLSIMSNSSDSDERGGPCISAIGPLHRLLSRVPHLQRDVRSITV